MKISSPAFENGGSIPPTYTCDGEDRIPPLKFEEIPDGARSLALIVDDPDVPANLRPDRNWDHWVVWNLPPSTTEVREGTEPGGVAGTNSWGRNDYGGPCPPDREHRYFFKLYALDMLLDLPPSAGKLELEQAMESHIVGRAELMGRYDRKR